MSFSCVKYISRWQSVGTLSLRFFRKALFFQNCGTKQFSLTYLCRYVAERSRFMILTTRNRFIWYIWKKIYLHKSIAKTVDVLWLSRSILFDLKEYIKQSAGNTLFIQIFVHGDSLFFSFFFSFFFFFFFHSQSLAAMNFNHFFFPN